MSTLPTPRTDAMCECYCGPLCWIGDQQFIPASFAQELERELTAAVAERDALKAEIAPLREIVGVRCDAESNPSDITNWLNLVSHADIAKRLKSDLDFSRHETRLQAEIATTLSADLSRWRALAEVLAGTLNECRSYLCTYRPDAIITIDQASTALAHYRDAANPASARTPKEEAP